MESSTIISFISLLITVFSIGISYGSLKAKIESIPKVLENYAKKTSVERSLNKLDDKHENRIREIERRIDNHETFIKIKGCRKDAERIQQIQLNGNHNA